MGSIASGGGTTPGLASWCSVNGGSAISVSITATLAGYLTGTISALDYFGVALLMAIESACIPLPSEIIMPFSGYLVSTGRFNLYLVATAGALGCNIGSTLAYLIGAYGGRRLVEQLGPYVLLDRKRLDRADRFFERYGWLAVLVARLLPIVRTFISLPAGIAHMRFWTFQICTFVGSWPWCLALAYVGLVFGREWDKNPAFASAMRYLDYGVLALIVLAVAWYVISALRDRKARRDAN